METRTSKNRPRQSKSKKIINKSPWKSDTLIDPKVSDLSANLSSMPHGPCGWGVKYASFYIQVVSPISPVGWLKKWHKNYFNTEYVKVIDLSLL